MKTKTNKISGTYKTDLTVRRRVFAGLCQSVQLKILLPEEKKINFFYLKEVSSWVRGKRTQFAANFRFPCSTSVLRGC